MPAVTVDDLTVLPRLRAPGLSDVPRPVWQVTTAPQGFEGEGFPVGRAFAGIDMRQLDPFIHVDQMGEVDYAPGEPKGTPWHPHRGFETVTYIIDGQFDHQDSHGGGGSITNGDTQWMTAGSGLLHIEAPPEWLVERGGLFHGFQLWVNLPRDTKMAPPRYQDLRSGGRADHVVRRRRTDPGDRGAGRRGPRAGLHAHPDVSGARHRRTGCPPRPALERRLQRAGLRVGRARERRYRLPTRPDGSAGGLRRGRLRDHGGRPTTGRETPTRWTSSSWAAGRSANRSPGQGRS